MKNPPRERPVKDERDEMIDRDSRNWSLELMICATQVLTIICAVKGNSAWKGSLSLLFFGVAAGLIYKYKMYGEKPYLYVGLVFLEAFYDFVTRHVLADNLVRLAVSKVALHAQQHVFILRALLQESLQGGVHFAALAFHHVHHAQAADAVEERLIFLVIDKERQLFHFRNHATASFLCSW